MNILYILLNIAIMTGIMHGSYASSNETLSGDGSKPDLSLQLESFKTEDGSGVRPIIISPMTRTLNRQVSHISSQLFDLSVESTPTSFSSFCENIKSFKARHYAALSKSRVYVQQLDSDESELCSAVHFNSVVIARLREIAIDNGYEQDEIPSPISSALYDAKLGISFGNNHNSDNEQQEDDDQGKKKRPKLLKHVDTPAKISGHTQHLIPIATAVLEQEDSWNDTILFDGVPFKRVESAGDLSEEDMRPVVATAVACESEALKSKPRFTRVKDSNWVYRHKKHLPKK